MFVNIFTNKITISRPLFFLCGPYYQEGDKRDILEKEIKKHKRDNISPYPVIVDKLFQDSLIEEEKLDLSLLEEIVAAISYRTYIFLDSLSTAYELGLFKNSKSNNSVSIFVEEEYRKRKMRSIGEFIQKNIDPDDKKDKKLTLHKYKAIVIDATQEFYNFYDYKVSDTINKKIDSDLDNYTQDLSTIDIKYTKGEEELSGDNQIVFKLSQNQINSCFSIKSLFYYLSYYLDTTEKAYTKYGRLSSEELFQLYKDFKRFIKRAVLSSDISELEKMYCYHDNQINIDIDQYHSKDSFGIFKTIYYLIVILMKEKEGKEKKLTSTSDYYLSSQSFTFHLKTYLDKCAQFANQYNTNQNRFVDFVEYPINGKWRKITKYKNSFQGKRLESFHEFLNEMLRRLLPTSDRSFAYKSNLNTRKCLEKHLESSSFLKLDIHNYFESIKFSILFKKIKEVLAGNCRENGQTVFLNNVLYQIKIIIRSCFYKRKLPIGFITSPILSDFYLYDLDSKFNNIDLIYTRYADDILVSSKDSNYNFDDVCKLITTVLSQWKLEINEKKTIRRVLSNKGDYIKFLGIVLLKEETKNVLRISNSYLLKTCKVIENSKDLSKNDKANGMVNYIKCIDIKSLLRLKQMFLSRNKSLDAATSSRIVNFISALFCE